MSTRACYVFIPHPADASDPAFTVFKHHDGYPSGAAFFLNKTLPLAWPLPRYENDEFACSFIAANKVGSPGGLRLTTGPEVFGDLAWVYEIEFNTQALIVTAWSAGAYDDDNGAAEFNGTLADFTEWSKTVGPSYEESPSETDQLWTALADVMPYALSRVEDMVEHTESVEGTDKHADAKGYSDKAAAAFDRANQLFIDNGREDQRF